MTGHEQTFQQTLTRFGHDRTKQLHYAETKIQRRLVLLYLQNRLHRATRHSDWRKSISLQVCKRADKAGPRCLTETGRSRRQFELLEVTGQHDDEQRTSCMASGKIMTVSLRSVRGPRHFSTMPGFHGQSLVPYSISVTRQASGRATEAASTETILPPGIGRTNNSRHISNAVSQTLLHRLRSQYLDV